MLSKGIVAGSEWNVWLDLIDSLLLGNPFSPKDPPMMQRGWAGTKNSCCLGFFLPHCCLIFSISSCFPTNDDSVQKQGDRILGTNSAVGCWMPMSSWYLICHYFNPGICRRDPEAPISPPWEMAWWECRRADCNNFSAVVLIQVFPHQNLEFRKFSMLFHTAYNVSAVMNFLT